MLRLQVKETNRPGKNFFRMIDIEELLKSELVTIRVHRTLLNIITLTYFTLLYFWPQKQEAHSRRRAKTKKILLTHTRKGE